ncbi:C40 family peptidase [Metabacillus litoralis]|uniref:C40 family peptidase n=1 Tax=Metabacillus litoralis TaxID=152268 RepID=UPI001CFF15DB|nr:C40 family peptidase [Metabacillus litoralis]
MKKTIIVAIASMGLITTGFTTQTSAHELTYKVQSGDSLWKISSQQNLTVQQLLQYNNLSSSTIYVGQELTLVEPHNHETTIQGSYTVKSGDSLSLIAKNHLTTVTDLKTINSLTSDVIFVGQVLTIPSTNLSTTKTTTSSTTYTVKSGDSLWRISQLTGVTVSDLKTYNNLTTDNIYVGQVLKLTGNSTVTKPPLQTFNADALVLEAKKYVGVPYVWGGNTPSGFDCSGFLNYVYQKQGISIPRTVATIWETGKTVSIPQKGDLVFFSTTAPGPTHAGIYLGDNKFIHAGSSTGVTISDMTNSYWKPRYLGVKTIQ